MDSEGEIINPLTIENQIDTSFLKVREVFTEITSNKAFTITEYLTFKKALSEYFLEEHKILKSQDNEKKHDVSEEL